MHAVTVGSMACRRMGVALLISTVWVVSSPTRAWAVPIYGIASGNTLLRFDSANPGAVTVISVTGIGASETIRGIDFRPRTGQLYAATVTTGSAANSIIRTYIINPLTGAATLVGQTAAALAGAGDVPTGIDFNPTVDRIRFVNTNDENARLNPTNGALAGNDTDLTPAALSDIIAAAYDRNFDRQSIPSSPASPANNPIPTTLYVIDRNNSVLARQGGVDGTPSPNGGVITTVGSLGFTLSAAADGGFDIAPGPLQQRVFAALTDSADDLTRLYSVDLSTGAATSIGLIGNGLTQLRSIAIAFEGIEVVAADAGGSPVVRVYDSPNLAHRVSFLAYPFGFTGGVRVATGDVNGDGMPEIITAPGPGAPPHVQVIAVSGVPFPTVIGSFLAFDPFFTGGVFVASGDTDADGFDEIIVSADVGGGPHVRVISGRTGFDLFNFFAYNPAFTGGVRVAAGDVNGDGRADIITGAGPGGGPHVRVLSGVDLSELAGFFAYGSAFTGGVYVAAGDVNGDARADVIMGAGAGGGPHVRVLSGASLGDLANFFAYDPAFTGGVRVAAGDVNGDGRADIITGAGTGGGPHVRIFSGSDLSELAGFFAFPLSFFGGVFVW